MGATTFVSPIDGMRSADEAFRNIVASAINEHGGDGYTGTIAEKDSYEMIELPPEWTGLAQSYIKHLLNTDDERISDKWGPAGCIQTSQTSFIFFGWAST